MHALPQHTKASHHGRNPHSTPHWGCTDWLNPAASHWGSIDGVLVPTYIARTLADTSVPTISCANKQSSLPLSLDSMEQCLWRAASSSSRQIRAIVCNLLSSSTAPISNLHSINHHQSHLSFQIPTGLPWRTIGSIGWVLNCFCQEFVPIKVEFRWCSIALTERIESSLKIFV